MRAGEAKGEVETEEEREEERDKACYHLYYHLVIAFPSRQRSPFCPGCKNPIPWLIFHCFPKCISKVLSWKCSRQNWHLYGMLATQPTV